MKIAFIGGRTIKTPDGIATFMYNLATELVKLGHEPIVYQESNINLTEYVNGFKVVQQRSYRSAALTKILLGFKSTLIAMFREDNVEFVHYNGWGPSLLSSWIPTIMGRKSILHGHGLEWKRRKYSPRQQKIMKFMEWMTAKLNKNCIMCSQEQTDYFMNEYNRKCVTITGGVNLPPEKTSDSTIIGNFDLKPGSYFLFMGRLVQEKNPDYLIKGFIKSCINDKQLVLAGSNDADFKYVDYLKELAKTNSNIIFTGAVFGEVKDALFRNCFAYVLPSSLEGLPISLLEAMSYGKVCVASDIPANKEALGDSGVWVGVEDVDSIAEKLLYVKDNYYLLMPQMDINKKRVETEFSWPIIARKYVDYLNSIS